LIRGKVHVKRTKHDDPVIWTYSASASEVHQVLHPQPKRKLKIESSPEMIQYFKHKKDTSKWTVGQIVGRYGHEQSIDNIHPIAENSSSHKVTITIRTGYNYVRDKRVSCINKNQLLFEKHKRKKIEGKRINGVSIDKRPETVNNRTRNGDLEIDLIVGVKETLPCLLTLIDRKIRKGWSVIIPNKTKCAVINGLHNLQRLRQITYGKNCLTITTDNGSEFRDIDGITTAINKTDKIELFFAHPYSPWEKGAIEHFNGLIRRWFPKGTDFNNVTQTELDNVVNEINNTPMAMFQYKTPNEMYALAYTN
jgi:IS30 family transposase